MGDLKSLKSIDLSSTTIIGTSISLVWSIIFTVAIIIVFSSVLGRFDIIFGIIGIAIIFGTIIFSISGYFGISFLYNYFANRMGPVKLNIAYMSRITNVSVVSSSLIVALISLIVALIIYPLIFLILSFVSIIIQLLQVISLQGLAWLVYPASLALTPFFIIYAFIIGLIFTIICVFIFNKVNPKIGGLKLSLSQEGKLTKIDSVNPKSVGIMTAIISLVFGLIYGIVFSMISKSLPANLILIVGLTIGGFIGGFIYGTLSSILYNFFAKKFGPVKLELK